MKVIVTVVRTYALDIDAPDMTRWHALSDRELAEVVVERMGDTLRDATYTVERVP